MLTYSLRRIFLLIPVIIGITILVFLMRIVVPGDPIDIMFFGRPATPELRENIREELGLNEPIPKQYWAFITGAIKGDLGNSIRTRQPVMNEISARFYNTFKLTLASLFIAVLIGILTGILAAVYKDSWIDFFSMIISLIGVSMPAFWLGLLLIMNLGIRVSWLPIMGAETWRHFILPSLTLGLINSAIIARMTRSCLLDVMQMDYVRTAYAKGLTKTIVILKHALRNALIPVVTIIGTQFGYLLGGAFVIEVVFSFPGIGLSGIHAIQYRDFPMIQGITLIVAITFVLVNLFVDLFYSFLNPQIRFD